MDYEAVKVLFMRQDAQTRAHARRVAGSWILRTDDERVAAGLHDVIEDGHATFDEVELAASTEVACIVAGLTRQRHETYSQYLDYITIHPAAARIKVADMLDNISRSTRPNGRFDLLPRYLKNIERMIRASRRDDI